jgi:hypothetical protein
VIVLMVLLLSSLVGLVVGRWRALALVIPATLACALTLGAEVGMLATFGAAGMALGVHLHGVVAEQTSDRTRPL